MPDIGERKAAETIVAACDLPGPTYRHAALQLHGEEVARAYLALLDERDREAAEQAVAVDEEWALATFERGNSPDRNTKRFWFGDEESVLVEAYACAGPKCWNWALYCYGHYVKNDPTRGDVLRLLAALGINVERGGE